MAEVPNDVQNAGPAPAQGMLTDFWRFVVSQHDWRATLVKLATASPLLTVLTCAGPPWPSFAFVAIATVVCQLLILAGVYALVDGRFDHQQLRTLILALLGFTALFALFYVALFSFFTIPAQPGSYSRVVIGYEPREEIKKHYAGKELPSPEELYEGMGRRVEAVWTSSSLAVARISLLLAWLGLFTSVSSIFSVVVLIRRPADRPPPAAPGNA